LSFKDFGGADFERGDILNFIDYMRGWQRGGAGCSLEAIRWLKDFLRIEELTPAQRQDDEKRARAREEKENADSKKKVAGDRKRALYGTVGEIYARERRGLDFDQLPKGPRGGNRHSAILHFADRMKHIDQQKIETWWPCIVAPCVEFSPATGKGKTVAIHRTYITPDGSDKAPVDKPRKVWPASAGSVIPLWRGESNLSIAEAIENGLRETFVFTEGWEDGYSAVLAAPQYRTLAALSLSNLVNIVLPKNCDSILLHRQNDWDKPAALQQFEAAKAHFAAQGRPVAEIKAFVGKDLNDTLRAGA